MVSSEGVNAFAPDSFSGLSWDQNTGEQFYKTAKEFITPAESVADLKSKSIINEEQHRDASIVMAKGRMYRLKENTQKKHQANKKKGIEQELDEMSYAEVQVLEFLSISPSSHEGVGRKQLRSTMIGYAEPEIERPNNSGGRKKRFNR
jgi:hypothetical protein